ncbi:MAG: LiaF-related protein [Longimicrobiales bacterium]
MSTDKPTSLRQARDATIDALCKGFAEESLSLSELERRLETARSARTREELNQLLRDIDRNVPMEAPATPTAGREQATARRPKSGPEPAERGEVRSSSHLAVAIMGGTRRAGRWAPPGEMAAVALMGGVELDFRDAVLQEGTTEINCFAFWGGVEITVPPGVEVESHGFAVMGGFDQDAELDTRPGPDAPKIRVNGFALMGAVEIKVAEPGS